MANINYGVKEYIKQIVAVGRLHIEDMILDIADEGVDTIQEIAQGFDDMLVKVTIEQMKED